MFKLFSDDHFPLCMLIADISKEASFEAKKSKILQKKDRQIHMMHLMPRLYEKLIIYAI